MDKYTFSHPSENNFKVHFQRIFSRIEVQLPRVVTSSTMNHLLISPSFLFHPYWSTLLLPENLLSIHLPAQKPLPQVLQVGNPQRDIRWHFYFVHRPEATLICEVIAWLWFSLLSPPHPRTRGECQEGSVQTGLSGRLSGQGNLAFLNFW